MKIERRRSNFSQFSDDLWLTLSDGSTTIDFDVDQEELLSFALHLLNVADDCLLKSKKDTKEIVSKLGDLMEEVYILNKT